VGFADAKDTHILYINPAGRKMVGVQAQEDVVHLKITDVHPEWTNKLFRDEIIPSAIRDGMWTGECAFLNRDGREIPVMMVLLAHKSPSGEVERFSTISIDITERKEAEEEIRALAKFPSENPDPIMRISTRGTLLYINESGSRQLSEWDLQAGKIVPPMLRDAVGRALNHGSSLVFDLEHNERVYSFTVTPISDAGYANLYGRDITERMRSIEARTRLGTAVEQSAEGIVITDTEGRIEYVNPSFERITGYLQEEVVGQNMRILKSGKQDEMFYKNMWETISRGEVWRGQIFNKKKDGTLYEEDSVISPVRNASGKIIHFVAGKRDITRDVMLQKQLQTAQKMESVGTLAGGIAHDFNNVLTVIIGFGEMLKLRIANDPKAISDLDEVLRSAERASVLTRQLLTFARRQIIEVGNLDMNHVITNLEKFLRKVTREDIEIRTCLAEGLPTIRADQGQIEQVLMNLCLNARDAMPIGGQLVVETSEALLDDEYVKKYPYMKPGRYAVLSVSDTGVGMDEATRERIFEPFFTTKGPDKGTGLGLAVVYGIVKQHNGYIHVNSEQGKGTTFRVYLPAVDASADARVSASQEIVRGGSETILLAEDDESIRNLTEKTLSIYGYRVLVASNGEEAVDIFRRHGKEIAMAVLDVVMPKMGGKQAYDEMITAIPGLKVLFLSGYSANAIHDSFVLHPGIPFLQKPFGPGTLARKVREVLGGK
jgi:two-component system NtrC family sensor kinase